MGDHVEVDAALVRADVNFDLQLSPLGPLPLRQPATFALAIDTPQKDPTPPGWGILPASAHAPPDVYIEAAVATSRSLANAHPEYTPAVLREALALQPCLSKETLPTMLSIVIPWAENFCTVFLAEQEKVYQLRVQSSQQVNDSSSNPCTPRSVSERAEFNASARSISLNEKYVGGVGSGSAGSNHSAVFDSPGKEVPGVGSRGGSGLLLTSKTGKVVSGLNQLQLLESRLSFGSFADSLDGYSVGSDGVDTMEDMGVPSGNGHSQSFAGNVQVSRSQILQSEWMLLCVFQMTKLCGWPPLHAHQLRALWEAVLSAPEHSRDLVAVYVTEFLLHSHMSGADPPEFSGYIQRGGSTVNGYGRDSAGSLSQQKHSGSRLGGRPIYSRSNSASRVDTVDESGMSVGLDQRLAKLVVSYIMSSASGPLIFQRLLANVRSYTLVAGSDNRGSLSIAWESARFTSWAVSAQEHSALVLLTDTAYQQDYVLVPHLPTLLQCAIVLLRPRIEHRCPESHALIPYIVHSLAVRCAPHKKVRELAQEFINKFYPSRAPLAHIAPIPGMEHQEPGGPLDPEECLSTPFVLELVSLLSYHRPRLRVDWAEMALSWTIHSTDKRIVLDSLRVFTVLNQSISISLLAKVGRLLLASIRIEEHGVADALLEIFGKASMILKKETEMPRSEEPSEALASSWLETWDMLSSVALTAMTSPSIRIFHRAITLVESLFCLQSLMTDTIQLVVSLEPFWRVISEVPLDVAISDLLFRGLLSTKTAPSTLWMYETFATAYADWLSADNKLVVMVLLLNAALVEMGEQGRCRAVIRFIENCGFALNDISAVFTAHEEGLYRPGAGARQPSKQAGEKATVPIPSSEGSADNTKPSFASKGSAEGGQENASKAEDGGKAGNNGSTTEWTEHERHDGVSQTATQEPSSSRRVSRRDMLPGPIGAYSADGYQFFDDFFDAFSLVFPSEEVWTFALKSVIALIVRGQQLWRAPFMKLLRSLLLYHVHAWSEEHFGMVADMLVQISSVEGTEIEEGMKQKGSAVREDPALVSAKEDIRAIIVECASFSVSQRVVDALHICLEMDRLKKEGSPGELRGSFRKSFSFPKNRGSSAFEGYEHQSTPSIADELFPGYSFGDPEIGVLKDWAGRWFLEYILPRRLGGSGEEDIQRDLRSDDTSGTVKREGTSSPKNAAGSTVKTSEDFGRTNDAKQEAQDEGMVEDKVGKIPCPSAEVDDGLWGTVKMDMEEIGDKDDKAVNTKLPQPCEERALEEASFAIEKLRPKSDTVDHVSRAEVMRAKQQYAAPVEAEEEEDEHERSKKIEMVRGMLERGERMDDSKAASTGTGTETTTRTLQGHEVRAREISSPEVAEGVSGVEKAALAVEKEHNEEASGRVEKGIHTAEEEEDYKDDAAARDSSDESDDEGLEHETGRRESLVVEVKEVTLGRREKITLSEQPANEMPLPVEEAQKSGVENMGVSSKPVADDDGFGQEIGDEEAGMVGRQRVANDDGSEKEDESSDDDDTELQSLVERLELDESENEDDSAEVQQRVERLMMSVRGSMNFEENDLIEEDFDEEANVERGGTEEGSSAVEHDTEEMWNDRNRELVEGEEIQGEEREAELVEDVAEYEGEGEMNIGMGAVRDQRCKGEDGRPTQQDEASNVISGTELQNADEEEVEGSLVAASGDRHALAEEETEVLAEREMSESVEATDVKTKQEEPRRTQLPLMVQRANAINAIIEEQRLRMSPTREEFDRRYGRQLLDGLGRTGSTGEDGLFGRPRPMASIGFGYRLGFTLDVKIKKPTIKKGEEEKSEAETDVSETGDMPEDVFDEDSSKLPMSPLPQETEVEDDEESSDGEDMRSEFYDDESVQEESAWGAAGGRGHDRGFSVGSPFEGLYIDQLQEMEVENRTRGAAGTDFGHLQVEIDRSGPLEHRLMMPLKFPVNQIDRLKNDWNAPSPGAREKSGVKFGVGGFYGMWGGGVDADMKESESSSNRSSIGDGNAAHVPEHKRANSFSSEGSSTSGDPEDGGTGVVGDGRGLPQANEPHTFIFRPGDRGYGREPERGPMDTSMLQSWADEDEQQHHSLRSSPGFGVDRDSFAKADEERQGSGRRPVFERGRSSLLRRWLG
ncbi:hypothetical protein CBR_g21804 [Chara braunii]|uniref:Uncharacterized protein n=1 Tax=Chara braunii TaxID=69332 RepID=A0A388JUG9_CHABU|nr:hypothetical protein CBR_g21804 [Chara braunii]|eukprot:GBG61459.1 hypothetical protein CBR_g21804 [Chara braunii]